MRSFIPERTSDKLIAGLSNAANINPSQTEKLTGFKQKYSFLKCLMSPKFGCL